MQVGIDRGGIGETQQQGDEQGIRPGPLGGTQLAGGHPGVHDPGDKFAEPHAPAMHRRLDVGLTGHVNVGTGQEAGQ